MNAITQKDSALGKVIVFLEMIKFSHTIFALPFALSGALLAAGGLPEAGKLFWIVVAMVGGRTAAMGLNRLIDADIDARNPRTAGRAIPAGLVGKSATLLAVTLSLGLMLLAAARLNPFCLKLSPLAIFFLIFYSYCKRFTALSHVVLGLCLSAAPLGAWAAIRGSLEAPALILAGAVLFWTAGFDILYALQDLEFDRSAGLRSIPALLGVRGALITARIFHALMLLLLLCLVCTLRLGSFFMTGLLVTTTMLLYEHLLLKDGDLRRLDAAFFNMNSYISVVILLGTAAEVLTRNP